MSAAHSRRKHLLRRARRLAACLGVAGLAFVSPGLARADLVTATWVGGTGNWNVAGNWSPAGVPNNGTDTYTVLIDNGSGTASVVNLDIAATISNLTIDTGDQLNINNSRTLTVTTAGSGGTIANAGTIALNAVANATILQISGDVTLNGGGTVTLGNSTSNRVSAVTAGDRLTNVNNTLQGAGSLGFNTLALTNQGTVIANQTTALTLDPVNGANGVINTGTLRASGSGGLLLTDGTFNNTGGIIEALTGSEVRLSGTTIQGGTLQTSGTGVVTVTAASTLDGVTNTGSLQVNNGVTATASGTLSNSGTLGLNAVGSVSTLQISGDVTLNGGGTVNLSNNVNNRISAAVAGQRLTNVNNTIQGAGIIGNNNMAFTNQSLVHANSTSALTINPVDGANGVINTGTLRASGSGGLLLTDGTFNNTGGIIEALTGSEVRLSGATIQGGTLQTSGTGVVTVTAASTLDGVTNTGSLQVNNGVTATASGTLSNSGTLGLNAIASLTALQISGDVTLNGGGTVNLSNSVNNRISASVAGQRLTNVNNTIQGAGTIGNDTMAFTNQSLVHANSASALTINPVDGANGVINTGTLRASGSGGLLLTDGTFNNTGGIIEALTGSEVRLSGATIQGGTLQTSGTGVVTVTAASTLDGVTNTGSLQVNNGVTATASGTLSNSGTLGLNAVGSVSTLQISGDVTLNGGGTVNLSNSVNNRISASVAGQRLTNVNNTIQGAGNIGNNTMALTNSAGGTILANVSSTLTIDPGTGGFTNNGTLQANSGSLLVVNDGFTNLASNTLTGGTYRAFDGTLRFLGGMDITTNAATILLDGPNSRITKDASNTNALGSLASNTASGSLTIQNGRSFTTSAALNNAGTVVIGNSSTLQVGASGTANYTQTAGSTSGTGTLDAGLVDVQGGTLSPGASAGTLTVNGDLTLNGPAVSLFELGGTTQGTQYDFLDVNGTFTAGGFLQVTFLNGFQNAVTPSNVFIILAANSAVLGSFPGLASGDRFATQDGFGTFQIFYGTGSPHGASNVVLTNFEGIAAVPEPSSFLLACGAGLALLAVGRLRRRPAAPPAATPHGE